MPLLLIGDSMLLKVTYSMQLLVLSEQVNDISMENTVHEHAVATLKAAKDRVVLLVGKPTQDASPFHTLSSGKSHFCGKFF